MSDSPYVKKLTLGAPATYRIEVQGNLAESWSGRLSGMRIETSSRGDQKSITTLTGRVRDQAELAGVLNSLYEMHFPILSVDLMSIE